MILHRSLDSRNQIIQTYFTPTKTEIMYHHFITHVESVLPTYIQTSVTSNSSAKNFIASVSASYHERRSI